MSSIKSDNLHLGSSGTKAFRAGLGVAGLGLVLMLVFMKSVEPYEFFRSYLTAFMLIVSISLGGLIFTMIQHATRAGWGVAIRRIFEVLASNLFWIWILFIPVAVAMFMSDKTGLYMWATSGAAEDTVLAGKAPFLNKQAWLIGSTIYFVIWGSLAWFYLKNSTAQDESGNVQYTHRMQALAPVGCMLFAVSITAASIHWMKSLEPHWFSTMFGVYFFAASCCAFFSFLILVVYFLQRGGKLVNEVSLEHYQDMGKHLFAFGVVFWTYIAFSQFMLIWYANMPEETSWYMVRSNGGWMAVSVLLLVGHFIAPFVLLVSKHPKRIKSVLAVTAGWMLFMSFVDFYWICKPRVPAELLHNAGNDFQSVIVALESGTVAESFGFHPHVVDIACLMTMLGLYVAGTVWRLGRQSLIAQQDPRLQESLAFENM